jgi:hypothetical protein
MFSNIKNDNLEIDRKNSFISNSELIHTITRADTNKTENLYSKFKLSHKSQYSQIQAKHFSNELYNENDTIQNSDLNLRENNSINITNMEKEYNINNYPCKDEKNDNQFKIYSNLDNIKINKNYSDSKDKTHKRMSSNKVCENKNNTYNILNANNLYTPEKTNKDYINIESNYLINNTQNLTSTLNDNYYSLNLSKTPKSSNFFSNNTNKLIPIVNSFSKNLNSKLSDCNNSNLKAFSLFKYVKKIEFNDLKLNQNLSKSKIKKKILEISNPKNMKKDEFYLIKKLLKRLFILHKVKTRIKSKKNNKTTKIIQKIPNTDIQINELKDLKSELIKYLFENKYYRIKIKRIINKLF